MVACVCHESACWLVQDNYQLNIYDPAYFTSANCPIGLMQSLSGSFCQLMGPYRMPLNDYNTIQPYSGMNNKCPSQWPGYVRCPANKPQCC